MYNNHIFFKIKSEYEKRQKKSHRNLLERQSEIYSLLPEIKEIDNRISMEGIKLNKSILQNNNKSNQTKELHLKKIESLKSKKGSLLANAGYPENYLEQEYICPLCKDTGFIKNVSQTEKCSCHQQLLINYLYGESNLTLAENENFSNFDESFYPDIVDEKKYGISISPRENIRKIKLACTKFLENFDLVQQKNLYFCGPTGMGKTFMSNCIAAEILKMGKTVLYQTAPMLFDAINIHKSSIFKNEWYNNSNYNSILRSNLLIIDDLGIESPTASRYAELLNILNIRQINNLKRPCKTIISTNIDIRKLKDYYGERVTSRIIGNYNLLLFAGDDIRRLKNLKRL